MNNAILHISDFHFPIYEGSDYRINTSFQTLFINSVKNKDIKYLIVTGDISNESCTEEYNSAKKFLNQLVEKLNINKKNILICPGNHDISRHDLNEKRRKGEIPDVHKEYESHDIKFQHFKTFYDDFFSKEIEKEKQEKGTGKEEFNNNAALFDKIIDNTDNIIICGINTCYRESSQPFDHIGFINEDSLEKEISSIDFNNKYQKYGKFLAMHHNPKDLNAEGINLDNWNNVKSHLNYLKPFTVICGHIHGTGGVTEFGGLEGESISYISVGSLTQKNNNPNTYNIYVLNNDQKLSIHFSQLNDPDSNGIWSEIIEKKQEVAFRPKQQEPFLIDKSKTNENAPTIQPKNTEEQINKIKQKSIIHFIKEQHLFKSGHFHWKNDFRSHGFIDINNLVSRKDSLEVITKQFYEQISTKFENKFADTIMIAVGIECNIIGARLSALFDCDYSFIPEPTKDEHFTEIEKKIKSENHKNIILLKDIIFTAEHSKTLLEKKYIQDKKVCIVSLFYCGNKNKKQKIFSDYTNVSFVSICDDLEINQCDYSNFTDEQCKNKCPIYRNDLETIYEC